MQHRVLVGPLFLTLVLIAASACKKDDKGDGDPAEPPPASTDDTSDPEPADESASERPEGPTGTIKGRVTLAGEAPEMPLLRRGSDPACAKTEMKAETVVVGEDGGLKNALVRIAPGSVPGWVPPDPVEVDQVDCMYRPRVQGAVTGQTVLVANSDTTMHNVHAFHQEMGRRQATDTITNRAQPAGIEPMEIPVLEQDIIKLKCDIHGWMQAFVLVSDNPYFAVSGDDGTFEIEGAPVGEHPIEVWHELYGTKEGVVTVSADGEATIDFEFDAAADNPHGGAGSAK